MSTSSRVIKNTGYLYAKMGITILISLYSTRLILASLGKDDFGIYNVVGGVVALFGFFSGTLANATQRFMSYAEGERDLKKKIKVFNVSVVLNFFIAILTALLLIVSMYPLFHGVFNISSDRIFATQIVYYCLIFSTILTIINVPYEAVMNAHENMKYYSIIGIFESSLRLVIAFICVYTVNDKLIVYGVLMTIIPLITLSIMKLYCHRHYEECILAPLQYWDVEIVKQIAGFFGWNFLTAISSILSFHGGGIVLNHYFGTTLNAAQGIAQQVNGTVSSFSTNMMKALNPVIVKNAGAKNNLAMNRATVTGCKYSGFLIMFFGIPLMLEIQYVLSIWLKDVPEWAAIFVVMQLIQGIITNIASGAATAVYAQGDIKHYAIWKSIMNVLPLLITWYAFNIGGGPLWLYIPMVIIWAIGGDIVIIVFADKKCGINILYYVKEVIYPLSMTTIIMLLCGVLPISLLEESIWRLIITCIMTTAGMITSCFLFAMTKNEKDQAKQFVNSLLNGIR